MFSNLNVRLMGRRNLGKTKKKEKNTPPNKQTVKNIVPLDPPKKQKQL